MLPEPSVIQMKHFQHFHPKHENLTIYSQDSQSSISRLIQTSVLEEIPSGKLKRV